VAENIKNHRNFEKHRLHYDKLADAFIKKTVILPPPKQDLLSINPNKYWEDQLISANNVE
jgi:hypothetical protein